ncbi:MAG TPA: ATP synthase subunit I [Acidimicrobiales bacterium]|nr:ATP synthase subunit I [Acidimicrobiales bacterium]
MLTAFPISEIERVVRRTAVTAVILGVIAAVLCVILGQPYAVTGLAVGLGLALANHRVFQSSAMRFTTAEGVVNRKPFAGSVALRLGACTAVAIGLLIVDQPVGWGVIGGLALFQLTMLGSALVSLFRYQRQTARQGGADA